MKRSDKNNFSVWPEIFVTLPVMIFLLGLFIYGIYRSWNHYCLGDGLYLAVIILLAAYFFVYSFLFAPIKIRENKLILPVTGRDGFPAPLIFRRVSIEISSIAKIITKHEGWSGSINLRFGFSGVSLVCPQGVFQINYKFYRMENVSLLVEKLWQMNETIEIIDR